MSPGIPADCPRCADRSRCPDRAEMLHKSLAAFAADEPAPECDLFRAPLYEGGHRVN